MPVVVILSGDVPLVSAEAIRELVEAHTPRSRGGSATMATAVLDDPSGYGRVVRDADGCGRARSWRPRSRATPPTAELEIREVNTGIYVFAARLCSTSLPRLTADNAQGELYLPQVLDLLRADGGAVAAHASRTRRSCSASTTASALARVRALAQRAIHERHMRRG